jgi:hypothetical protein
MPAHYPQKLLRGGLGGWPGPAGGLAPRSIARDAGKCKALPPPPWEPNRLSFETRALGRAGPAILL